MSSIKKINGEFINDTFIWDGRHVFPHPEYFDENKLLRSIPEQYNENFIFENEKKEYERNLQLKENGWHYRTKSVEYKLNSEKYRTYEFDELTDIENSILLVGCSNTFGHGVSTDENIAYFLEQKTGRHVINLGVPSCSNWFISQNSFLFYKLYGIPHAVVCIWTTLDRFTYFSPRDINNLGTWNSVERTKNRQLKLWDWYNEHYTNPHIITHYISLNTKLFWENKTRYISASFYENSAHYAKANLLFPIDGQARDLVHPGPFAHESAANQIHDYMEVI